MQFFIKCPRFAHSFQENGQQRDILYSVYWLEKYYETQKYTVMTMKAKTHQRIWHSRTIVTHFQNRLAIESISWQSLKKDGQKFDDDLTTRSHGTLHDTWNGQNIKHHDDTLTVGLFATWCWKKSIAATAQSPLTHSLLQRGHTCCGVLSKVVKTRKFNKNSQDNKKRQKAVFYCLSSQLGDSCKLWWENLKQVWSECSVFLQSGKKNTSKTTNISSTL